MQTDISLIINNNFCYNLIVTNRKRKAKKSDLLNCLNTGDYTGNNSNSLIIHRLNIVQQFLNQQPNLLAIKWVFQIERHKNFKKQVDRVSGR